MRCYSPVNVKEAVRAKCAVTLTQRDGYRATSVQFRESYNVCLGQKIELWTSNNVLKKEKFPLPSWLYLMFGSAGASTAVAGTWCATEEKCSVSTSVVLFGVAVTSFVLGVFVN